MAEMTLVPGTRRSARGPVPLEVSAHRAARVEANDIAGSSGWQHRAACRDAGPALFFPADNIRATEERAKVVCSSCPVRPDCLAFAIEGDEAFGVWGGLTADDRRALVAQPRRGTCVP